MSDDAAKLEKPRESFRRMAAIANDPEAVAAERETARRIMEKYIERYGSEVAIPEAEPEIAREVPVRSQVERELFVHCSLFAGCEAYSHGKYLWHGTPRETFRWNGKTVSVRGAESAVMSAIELFELHRSKLEKAIKATAIAYCWGAMRLPKTARVNVVDIPDEFDEVSAAAHEAGKRYAARRLGAPKKEGESR